MSPQKIEKNSGLQFQDPVLRFNVLIYNIYERLSSQTGYAFTERGKEILLANINMQLFLHANVLLWNSSDELKALQ